MYKIMGSIPGTGKEKKENITLKSYFIVAEKQINIPNLLMYWIKLVKTKNLYEKLRVGIRLKNN